MRLILNKQGQKKGPEPLGISRGGPPSDGGLADAVAGADLFPGPAVLAQALNASVAALSGP